MAKPFAVDNKVWWRSPSRDREEGVVESIDNGIMFIRMTAPARCAGVVQSAKRVKGRWCAFRCIGAGQPQDWLEVIHRSSC